MNIVETQAKLFFKNMFFSRRVNNLEDIKSRLDLKIALFIRSRDKLDFLKSLRVEIDNQIKEHIKTCSKEDCNYENEKNLGKFLIDQEIDTINLNYMFEPKSEDKFTVDEETTLHVKLNEILDRLNKQGLGQEIIFEEIESLKNHFNLGKKTWFQLLVGKMLSVTGDKMIEETVTKSIINELSKIVRDSYKFIQ